MKLSEMIESLQKLKKRYGDTEVFVVEIDLDGDEVGLVPKKPEFAGGYIYISALAPLGSFGDDE